MATTALKTTLVSFDASAIIDFDNRDTLLMDMIYDFFTASNHTLVITNQNLTECRGEPGAKLRSKHPRIVTPNSDTIRDVRTRCESLRKRAELNDYGCIAAAIDEGCDFLVSSDEKLLEAALAYIQHRRSGLQAMPPASFLYYMFRVRQDLFPLRLNVNKVLDMYNFVELRRTVERVQTNSWELIDAQKKFDPYAKNISRTINSIKVP